MLTLKDGRLFSLYENQIFQTDNEIKFWVYQCAHTKYNFTKAEQEYT